jgi:hypothetical protein
MRKLIARGQDWLFTALVAAALVAACTVTMWSPDAINRAAVAIRSCWVRPAPSPGPGPSNGHPWHWDWNRTKSYRPPAPSGE